MNYKLKALLDKGRIVYEYNPLQNLRHKNDFIVDANYTVPAGVPTDFTTKVDNDLAGLNFDLTHPVDIQCQESYDGSVNLIINDNKNIPRLINTRFSPLLNNTYEIVDRSGLNDTNLYDEDAFDIDTSLYKRILKIPKILLESVLPGGSLSVGNYTVYLRYADADENETDFIAESGMISCFIGTDSMPTSINGGYKDLNSNKLIQLKVSNLDVLYDYLKVYYSRATSDVDLNVYKLAFEIHLKYPINGDSIVVTITGEEANTELPLDALNVKYFLASAVKTQTLCNNRLFFGNLTEENPKVDDLTDISLHIVPYYNSIAADNLIGNLNAQYLDFSTARNQNMYYNTKNIYSYVGYWPEEMYRFGIVYIMRDGSLSPVFNILGTKKLESNSFKMPSIYIEGNEPARKFLPVKEEDLSIQLEGKDDIFNSRGVVRFPDTWFIDKSKHTLLSINFYINEEIIEYLYKTYKIQGWFFVRQKRIPTILAQGWSLPMDANANIPTLWHEENLPLVEAFLADGPLLTHDYKARLSSESKTATNQSALICPEYETNQLLYDLLFTGQQLSVKKLAETSNKLYTRLTISLRLYGIGLLTNEKINATFTNVNIAAIPDSAPNIVIEGYRFRAFVGEPNDVTKFRYIGVEKKSAETSLEAYNQQGGLNNGSYSYNVTTGVVASVVGSTLLGPVGGIIGGLFGRKRKKVDPPKPWNLVRGIYGPYLGVVGKLDPACLYNIYIPGYHTSYMNRYFRQRYEDASEYSAISERYLIEDFVNTIQKPKSSGFLEARIQCYRGDCFICNFTHRLNRNFQDPSAPTNDIIVNPKAWKEHFSMTDTDETAKINRGDVNAIKLGSWFTVPVRATRNISLRATDLSYPTEEGMCGHPRGFYPLLSISAEGSDKIAESSVLNGGYGCTVGERWNYTLPNVPYYKNVFQTRIAYSELVIGDAFKNGYRVFNSLNYRDYPRTYGGIMKIIDWYDGLIVIFEHGICYLKVNERVVAGQDLDITIDTHCVLPETPTKVISDCYGSLWPDSVIKTPRGIYGVDTVAKKIWVTDGDTILCLSDFKMLRFLNENISLGEFEFTPIIGVRNVKTHYNAFKLDVMFTFYDTTKGPNEVSWNLCYNENLKMFITFYSWIPSFTENINNIMFSFDRDTSKYYSRLATTLTGNPEAYGVTLSSNNLTNSVKLSIDDSSALNFGDPTKTFTIERDPWGFYQYFEISGDNLICNDTSKVIELSSKCENLIYLKITGDLHVKATYTQSPSRYGSSSTDVLFGSYTNILALKSSNTPMPTTAFWKHGLAGLFDKAEAIKPTMWYGKLHPFEFEVIVADNPSMHKIFNNLRIMSNKAEPESFHYEIVGEAYDFREDKRNMYFRQEATKCLYLLLGSNITYDYKYLEEIVEAYYKRELLGFSEDNKYLTDIYSTLLISSYGDDYTIYKKSTLFPLTYYRKDKLNTIEDTYNFVNETYESWKDYLQNGPGALSRDYEHLAGAEITYDKLLNEFKVWNHAKAADIRKVGRLRGNMEYLEDMWDIQINPILFVEKNESKWKNDVPPIAIVGALPNDILTKEITDPIVDPITGNTTPGTFTDTDIRMYNVNCIDTAAWSKRKETKPRDKYLRVRVRYSGKDLALINSLITNYTISYA